MSGHASDCCHFSVLKMWSPSRRVSSARCYLLSSDLCQAGKLSFDPQGSVHWQGTSDSFSAYDAGPLVIITCICRTLKTLVQKDRDWLSTILWVRWQPSFLIILKKSKMKRMWDMQWRPILEKKNDLCQSQLRQANLGRLTRFIERFMLGFI